MYEKFYGLKEKPFQILSDPAYLFMSKVHESAYTHLEYGILENKGFVVITGEIGSGKTTLINYLLEKIETNITTALVNNTLVKPADLLKMLCQDFEIEVKGLDETELMTAFYQFLVEQYTLGKRVILIIDEAQNLSLEALEQVRMLSNFELDKQHLFQVILVGQPELRYKLRQKALEQLAQRVSVHYHISGLDAGEVVDYVKYRLKIAGVEGRDIFQEDALEAVWAYSRGIPRLINILCDTALVYGFADGLETIGRDVVDSVIREREVGGFNPLNVKEDDEEGYVGFDEGGGASAPDRRFPVERKLEMIENRLDDLEKRMINLMDGSGRRDQLILELFNLLQDNLKGRYRILGKLHSNGRKNHNKQSSELMPVKGDVRFRF
ncbi:MULTISPECIES: ExeA family protein [Desulfococcus]|uniref:General secretion pathway protein A n=1 Tax=Desulfococcus multivorans DSM 2059 TaxID=1121405 RepID=S7THA2_DESML|nr:AAA family ATPase [Desulfococcus multivorans]AOY59998.1 general secretion pathway protein A [Desulfococcus multivorans]AQV02142.1 general secretion pathway protein GspA [Desulfococcus multivorans]EPR35995.1 general secretion pathway protein A [Desulfococcus multivorans DSM 2059]SJZ36459.1 AAA domain-containing protein [Desulfococcus multivorans DSM 2059]